MSIEEFHQSQLNILSKSPHVQTYEIELDKRGPDLGLIRGAVRFLDRSILYYRELVDLEAEKPRLMYSYHYQQSDSSLIFRYDDTWHYPGIPGFPHHKHAGGEHNAIPADAPDLAFVLREIEALNRIV